ncbi:glycosyltransferase family protein [Acidimangrovimonas sediminis]|uniref:glycosyltransferase family protein n=1 Tax=Acidimangrovimonas sediminis TaxID=2056283 RepID=UPI000C806F75|nr:glycosyltransferase family protein [Acidimangrovimonas sediminis]
MLRRFKDAKILMYSHDTFGLGHLQRCRAIAHALAEDYRGLQILIISGATIAGAFNYRARVDFVKIPSVIKLRNGEYTPLEEHIDLKDLLKVRQSMIFNAAESFAPDIFIVDKEPLGLHGEVEETLVYLKARGTRLVLGLRDIMDSPHLLDAEWKRKEVLPRIGDIYDDIWVYGPKEFYDPLTGLDVPETVRAKMNFVGFLQRSLSDRVVKEDTIHGLPRGGYLLVTPGGGGDGAEMVGNVIDAYHATPDLPLPALVVLGPYMRASDREALIARAADLPQLHIIEFDNQMEKVIAGAAGVVAMGGYNTFCEILSFDRPALIVPRVQPREEQLLRAWRARELGLVEMLLPEEAADPARMGAALAALPDQPAPSANGRGLRLEGLTHISELVGGWLDAAERGHLKLVRG